MYEVFNWGHINESRPKRLSLFNGASEINIDDPPSATEKTNSKHNGENIKFTSEKDTHTHKTYEITPKTAHTQHNPIEKQKKKYEKKFIATLAFKTSTKSFNKRRSQQTLEHRLQMFSRHCRHTFR